MEVTATPLVEYGQRPQPGDGTNQSVLDEHAEGRVDPVVVEVAGPGRRRGGVAETGRLVPAGLLLWPALRGEVADQRARPVAGRVQAVGGPRPGYGQVGRRAGGARQQHRLAGAGERGARQAALGRVRPAGVVPVDDGRTVADRLLVDRVVRRVDDQ